MNDLISSFALPEHAGPDKRSTLSEAVRRFVRPGMTLELAVTLARPNGWIHELIRTFRGSRPDFTLVSLSLSANASLLVHAGLASRAVTTFCGDAYPSPSPNGILRGAIQSGRLAVENWSILTLPLRLKAAAMRVPELPTHSLVGSTMAEENGHAFTVRDGVGWVKPMVPDLTLIHALAADRSGNAVLAAPRGAGHFGALAAREGVLLSVEKIVSTGWIRRHAHLGFLPGAVVRAVAEAPLGAHPAASWSADTEIESYVDDYTMLGELHAAARSPAAAERWIHEWLIETVDHTGYLKKLGQERIAALRARAGGESWRHEIDRRAAERGSGRAAAIARPPTAIERQVLEAATWIERLAAEEHCATILAGIGNANLAAWLAKGRLEARGLDVSLMAELGMFGYQPRPFDPFVFATQNVATATWLADVETLMSMVLPSERMPCVGAIGAAEVDRLGNVNTTRLADGTPITGSGGGNDIASAAHAVVVTAVLAPGRFREQVGYVTSPGSRVRAVVTERGTFVKERGAAPLRLQTYIPRAGVEAVEEQVREIRALVGWNLETMPDLRCAAEPDPAELHTLRLFDPDRHFLG